MPAAVKAQIEQWRKTAQRYDTEPETNEGRKELMARAKTHEAQREKARAAYHLFEYGSAAFQLAIVLAGASALTAVAWLTFVSGGLGLRRRGLHVPGLLRADPGPPLGPQRKNARRRLPSGVISEDRASAVQASAPRRPPLAAA